ncbi:hypothetical protein [Croceivirga sp. JEA036]|uniref:hypothetical protein n=1 Tax=Croceivirga sp. JEA036 TaxID=2721162 RepID=UPI00143C50F0|nr:hypothetical protein [Croceivirga sp. JEA036]NJB37571.1 hypothetical protein [Croceivirga sp. JEA036]
MAQDLRKMFREERCKEDYQLSHGHETRFLERLDKDLPKRKGISYTRYMIAASIALCVGIATYLFFAKPEALPSTTTVVQQDVKKEDAKLSLGALSPELQKVETYYTANINYELSKLDVSKANKEVVDGYMDQLGALDEEYQSLNNDLNVYGPNDDTIAALIQNLQLRLQLLQKLKAKLNQLKSSKNEQESVTI